MTTTPSKFIPGAASDFVGHGDFGAATAARSLEALAAQAIARRLLQPDPDAGLPANTPPAARAFLQSATDLQSFLASRPDVREFLAGLAPEMRQMFMDSLRERIADQNAFMARYMPEPGHEFDDPTDEQLAAQREAELAAQRAEQDKNRQN